MQECIEDIVWNNAPVVVWGCGQNFQKNINQVKTYCNIVAVCDSNERLQGITFGEWICVPPKKITGCAENVIISTSKQEYIEEIIGVLKKLGLKYCLLCDLLQELALRREKDLIDAKYPQGMYTKPLHHNAIMKKYIGIHVPANECNLKCSYCYVTQRETKKKGLPRINHLPQYIRMQLSREQVGGEAFIVLCGAGETLLCNNFSEICKELLWEGHYLHIVTNGVLGEKIKEVLDKAKEYATHIMFKISFHYEQMKLKNKLEDFVKNIQMIEKSGASYTIEMMPYDELIPYIDEIKEFSMKYFGALPHLTIGRDDNKNQELLTNLTFEEYRNIWGAFDSELFSFKMDYYMCQTENCFAGKYSLYIDLLSGNVYKCLGQPVTGNLYDEDFTMDFCPVGNDCKLSYCYNCHAYVTLGNMPHIVAPSYLEVRDRVTQEGKHWIQEPMRRFIGQRLYENN